MGSHWWFNYSNGDGNSGCNRNSSTQKKNEAQVIDHSEFVYAVF